MSEQNVPLYVQVLLDAGENAISLGDAVKSAVAPTTPVSEAPRSTSRRSGGRRGRRPQKLTVSTDTSKLKIYDDRAYTWLDFGLPAGNRPPDAVKDFLMSFAQSGFAGRRREWFIVNCPMSHAQLRAQIEQFSKA